MRISGIGWAFDDLKTTEKMSAIVTGVTHNHFEGMKGAEVTAVCIYVA